jgi:hypothetical protein
MVLWFDAFALDGRAVQFSGVIYRQVRRKDGIERIILLPGSKKPFPILVYFHTVNSQPYIGERITGYGRVEMSGDWVVVKSASITNRK